MIVSLWVSVVLFANVVELVTTFSSGNDLVLYKHFSLALVSLCCAVRRYQLIWSYLCHDTSAGSSDEVEFLR